MYTAPLSLQTVHDTLPDNDLVPLMQLGDEQHITTEEENKGTFLLSVGFLYLKNRHTQYIHIFISDSKATPQFPSPKA